MKHIQFVETATDPANKERLFHRLQSEKKEGVVFKRLEDVPLEVVGQLIARTPVCDYIARIESVFASNSAQRSKSKAGKAKR